VSQPLSTKEKVAYFLFWEEKKGTELKALFILEGLELIRLLAKVANESSMILTDEINLK